jgi:hypothetical protein
LFLFLNGFVGLRIHSDIVEPDGDELGRKKIVIYRLQPEPRGGEAFKLVYLVPAPVDVYWRFKTDFDAPFLLSNRYIEEHRMILMKGNVTITENSYTNAPGETFRWQTTTYPDQRRLEFRLLNPQECGHRFHYGTIQIEPFGAYTKVSHVAYFDFFGAHIWVHLPFKAGMAAFLTYTARWEKETLARLRHRYATHAQE